MFFEQCVVSLLKQYMHLGVVLVQVVRTGFSNMIKSKMVEIGQEKML